MATQSTFILLVKQDLKRRSRGKRRIPRQWWLIYLAVLFLFAVVLATYAGMKGNIDIHFTWNFMPAMLFAVFGITIGLTIHEWKNGTVGWWLSLPFSRQTLAFSKFCAGLIRGILVILAVFVIIGLFGLYIMLLKGGFQFSDYFSFLVPGSKWLVFLIGLSPFMASLGLIYSVIKESRIRPILPLFWFCWGITWWLVSSVFSQKFWIIEAGSFTLSIHILYCIVFSWIIAYVLIHLSAYILKRQMAL
ncbi:MAG TPA: ABC transporter permease [Bacillales bacterium]|nr:ABC transporter permease [Bacillales bacterium]